MAHTRHLPGARRPPQDPAFVPGVTPVPYAGRVFDPQEVEAAVGAALDFWLTLGPEGEALEQTLASFLGVRRSILVKSGSSANLLAISALTSPKLGQRRILPGEEVITVAAGFPTTVAPIVQAGLVPVFIDNDPVTLNARVDQLEEAFHPGRTRAVMMAHTLGNPFDLGAVLRFCQAHDLWLIEDNCDALGSTYSLPLEAARTLGLAHPASGAGEAGQPLLTRLTGAWGDLSTQSFYPPHHLTLGEGGAVNVRSEMRLKVAVESFRDWGRDCWCASGQDNTCGKRFGWQLGEMPAGYDHKFTYSHLGYNLKPLDLQAAIGRRQMLKLPEFIEERRRNWDRLRHGLADLEEFFEFMLPTHATSWSPGSGFSWDATGCRTDCSWFGFMLRVRPQAPFDKFAFVRHLDRQKIGNRMLFGGNLVRQPAFVDLSRQRPDAFRVVGDLRGADQIMQEALFLGVYPGLSPAMVDYMIECIQEFVSSARG